MSLVSIITKFQANWSGIAVAEARVDAGGHAAAEVSAYRILNDANLVVPYLSGTLRDTGRVDVDGSEATVSYDTKYAAILHEHPEWNFRNGRDGHWLQDAVERNGGETEAEYAGQIRARL